MVQSTFSPFPPTRFCRCWPRFDVGPVQAFSLNRDHRARVRNVFIPLPAQFLNHNIFRRWDNRFDLQFRQDEPTPASKSILVVGIISQPEKLDFKLGGDVSQNVSARSGHELKTCLRIELEVRSQ
jgi:hypothetical protein